MLVFVMDLLFVSMARRAYLLAGGCKASNSTSRTLPLSTCGSSALRLFFFSPLGGIGNDHSTAPRGSLDDGLPSHPIRYLIGSAQIVQTASTILLCALASAREYCLRQIGRCLSLCCLLSFVPFSLVSCLLSFVDLLDQPESRLGSLPVCYSRCTFLPSTHQCARARRHAGTPARLHTVRPRLSRCLPFAVSVLFVTRLRTHTCSCVRLPPAACRLEHPSSCLLHAPALLCRPRTRDTSTHAHTRLCLGLCRSLGQIAVAAAAAARFFQIRPEGRQV
ncbi:unnamed protein product, partial [Protopolystoma xenopodis]